MFNTHTHGLHRYDEPFKTLRFGVSTVISHEEFSVWPQPRHHIRCPHPWRPRWDDVGWWLFLLEILVFFPGPIFFEFQGCSMLSMKVCFFSYVTLWPLWGREKKRGLNMRWNRQNCQKSWRRQTILFFAYQGQVYKGTLLEPFEPQICMDRLVALRMTETPWISISLRRCKLARNFMMKIIINRQT